MLGRAFWLGNHFTFSHWRNLLNIVAIEKLAPSLNFTSLKVFIFFFLVCFILRFFSSFFVGGGKSYSDMTKCTFYLFYLVFVDLFKYVAWCISSVLENSQALFLLILTLSICSLPSFWSNYMYVSFLTVFSLSLMLYIFTFLVLCSWFWLFSSIYLSLHWFWFHFCLICS